MSPANTATSCRSSFPALSIGALHPGVQFWHVGHLHIRTVPNDFLAHAGLHGEVAEDGELSQPGTVLEWHSRLGLAFANGVEKVVKDILRPRQGLGGGRRLLHLFVRNNVHLVAI